MPLSFRHFLHRLELPCICFGVAGAALAVSRATATPFADVKWAVAGITGMAALSIYGLAYSPDRRRRGPIPLLRGLCALGAAMLLSALAADEPSVALHGLPTALLPVAWGAMVLTIRWRASELLRFRAFFIALGTAVAAIGLAQYYAADLMRELLPYGSLRARGRATIISTIGNPEYVGGFLAPLAVLAAGATIGGGAGARSSVRLVIAGGATMVLLWALLLTEGRGAWIGFLVGIIVLGGLRLAPKRRREKKGAPAPARRVPRTVWISAASGVALFVFLLLPTPFNPYRVNLLRRLGGLTNLESTSMRQRLLLYAVASEMVGRKGWLGAGPEGFSHGYQATFASMRSAQTEASLDWIAYKMGDLAPRYVHCDPLQFWVEHGVLGLGAFLWLIAWSGFLPWRLRRPGDPATAQDSPRASRTGPDRRRAAGSRPPPEDLCKSYAAAWACCVVYSLFAFPFHAPDRALLFWTLFGLMGASYAGLADGSVLPGERSLRTDGAVRQRNMKGKRRKG